MSIRALHNKGNDYWFAGSKGIYGAIESGEFYKAAVELDNDDSFTLYEQLSDVASPDATLNRNRLEAAIYGVIKTLPEELKSAITLREFDGMSYEEISQVMDCPVGTVRSRIFRAREAVEKHIRPLLGEGE